MTDYSAHDIHRLDQAYPDALADIEAHIGDPKQKARLADKGPEVYAAELTRELADTATSPIALAAWAAIATVRLMEAGRVWEEDTDAAWAKVAILTSERDNALSAHEVLAGKHAALAITVDELTAERAEARGEVASVTNQLTLTVNDLTEARRQLTAANRRADGLEADLRSANTANTAWANENARLRSQAAELRALYTGLADGPPVNGDWLLGELGRLTRVETAEATR